MKTYKLHFSNGLIEKVQYDSLITLCKHIKKTSYDHNGFTTELIPDKILNLNQLVSVRELEEWELYDNNTP